MEERYNTKFAVSCARGSLLRLGEPYPLDKELLVKDFSSLTEEECEKILICAKEKGVKLYHFKKSDSLLPRVSKALGILKGLYFESLLDVGSGRGVFLLPFMESFPYVPVTSIDILDKRVEMLLDLKNGGISCLEVVKGSICDKPFPDKSFDVVTMLEVLEHIPDVEGAIESAVKIAKKYIIVSVPSREDNNPEHIHLLTKEKLSSYFGACGIFRLSFDNVPGHLIMIARL